MTAQGSLIGNVSSAVRSRLERLFPFAFANTKHDYAKDYGWPDLLTFNHFHRMYCRSGIAASAIDKTIGKTWSTMPTLWESEKPAASPDEQTIAKHFAKRKVWRALMDADRRSLVGAYAGAIIMLRDGKKLDEPVDRVPGGVVGLAGIVAAWEGQLSVVEWDTARDSDTFGEPLIYRYDEQAVGDPANVSKQQLRIHRDRVLIFSDDGTLNCRSALEPGFNDLTDAEKIKGAGGEGFWKSARAAPVVEMPVGMTMDSLMTGMGAKTPDEARDKLNDKVDEFQAGFDKFLMLGGMTAKPMQIQLPQPKQFWEPCVQSFAASMSIPFKVLVGNVTGERASTEDAREWAETCMSRRENRVLPILHDLIDRLVAWGVLPNKPWVVGWASLLEASPDDMLGRAKIMADINTSAGSEPAFLVDEIREAAGFKPSDEVDGFAEALDDIRQRRRDQAEDAPTVSMPPEQEPQA